MRFNYAHTYKPRSQQADKYTSAYYNIIIIMWFIFSQKMCEQFNNTVLFNMKNLLHIPTHNCSHDYMYVCIHVYFCFTCPFQPILKALLQMH